MRRRILKTPIAPTRLGVTRSFSRENALEIAFLTALVKASMSDLTTASMVANRWVQDEREGILKRYFIYSPREGGFLDLNDDISIHAAALAISDDLGRMMGELEIEPDPVLDASRPVPVICAIDRHEIVRRVDALGAE
jgi:hypothetical protein